MSPLVFVVFLASVVASEPSQPQQQKKDADIVVDTVKQFRSDETVDESEVKVRTKRDAAGTITLLKDSTANLQDRAVCPWTYSVVTDPNRQPADLVQAACTTAGAPGSADVCELVYSYVPIRVKQADGTTFVDDQLKLAVGCTLAQPRTAPAIPPVNPSDPTTDRGPMSWLLDQSLQTIQRWMSDARRWAKG